MLRIFALLALIMHPVALAQSVIINEISQGSDGAKEWVELLVFDQGVDMRGWELGDNDDGTWHSIATFTEHTDWSALDRGTLIVLYNSGDVDAMLTAASAPDTIFSDGSVLIPINNSSLVNDTGPWGLTSGAFANLDKDDSPALRNAGGEIIHDMAVTHPTATIPSPGSGKVSYFMGNAVTQLADPGQWVEAASTAGTPGQLNGGDNDSWADQSLPVELSSWTAIQQGRAVHLSWSTESEFENQGFILERRQALKAEALQAWIPLASFTTHPQLQGQGSTNHRSVYTFDDLDVKSGQAYNYRLSDVDYRGVVTQHSEVSILIKEDVSPASIRLFPNPSNSEVRIFVDVPTDLMNTTLDICDMKGGRVISLTQYLTSPGTNTLTWDGNDEGGNSVPSGVYMINFNHGSILESQCITLLR